MVALIDAIQAGEIPNTDVAVVISDHSEAEGLSKAQARGIEIRVIQRRGRSREAHDREIVKELKTRNVDLVCLAGYMRILSGEFLAAYRGRILNIHPSLLPAFPGLDAQEQALKHRAKQAGCTVHFVDETLDGGPIIAQRAVPIVDGDTVETLSARILQEEHKLYSEAVALVLNQIESRETANV